MSLTWSDANAFHRAVRRFAASGPGSWLFSRVLDRLDRMTLHAVEVEDERRERIWQEALRTYPGFAG